MFNATRRIHSVQAWATLQGMAETLAAFGDAGGSVPKEWKKFFEIVTGLEQKGQFEAISVALTNVLKGIVWSGDIMAQKASTQERWPYADVTMFIKNWGSYAPEVAQLTSGVQQKISADLVTAKDLMKCFRCQSGKNHVDSMCHTKVTKPYVRSRDRECVYIPYPCFGRTAL